MAEPFSPDTRNTLYAAGWTPARHVDITPYVDALEDGGYPVFPVVRSFLYRFGGLTLKHTRRHAGQLLTWTTDLDPIDATAGTYPETVACYVEHLGEALCIVGWIVNKHATLMMSPQGKVYSTYDNLVFWGDTGEQAIERLCSQRQGVLLLDE